MRWRIIPCQYPSRNKQFLYLWKALLFWIFTYRILNPVLPYFKPSKFWTLNPYRISKALVDFWNLQSQQAHNIVSTILDVKDVTWTLKQRGVPAGKRKEKTFWKHARRTIWFELFLKRSRRTGKHARRTLWLEFFFKAFATNG